MTTYDTNQSTPAPDPTSAPDTSPSPASDAPTIGENESFDERVSEHVRRSNEFMEETARLRDDAIAHHDAAERDRQALRAERAQLHQVIAELEAAATDLRQRIDHLHQHIVAARALLDITAEHEALPQVSAPQTVTGLNALPSRADASTVIPVPTTVLAHGVSRADDAIELQRYLRALDGVRTVDAREFSDGVLRLSVVAERALTADDTEAWDHPLTVVRVQDDVLEIQLRDG